jgi:hypothetical protein
MVEKRRTNLPLSSDACPPARGWPPPPTTPPTPLPFLGPPFPGPPCTARTPPCGPRASAAAGCNGGGVDKAGVSRAVTTHADLAYSAAACDMVLCAAHSTAGCRAKMGPVFENTVGALRVDARARAAVRSRHSWRAPAGVLTSFESRG